MGKKRTNGTAVAAKAKGGSATKQVLAEPGMAGEILVDGSVFEGVVKYAHGSAICIVMADGDEHCGHVEDVRLIPSAGEAPQDQFHAWASRLTEVAHEMRCYLEGDETGYVVDRQAMVDLIDCIAKGEQFLYGMSTYKSQLDIRRRVDREAFA